MNKSDLEIQKKLVAIFVELEKEIKTNESETNSLGWGQRNALISHVYSNYDNHDELNSKREAWNSSVIKGNVLAYIHEIFVKHRDLYGYFKDPKEIEFTLSSLKRLAINKEEYKIAGYLNEWLLKFPKSAFF